MTNKKLTWKQTGVLLAALACLALPAQAQKGKTLSKVVDAVTSRKAVQQAVRNPHYNSVLGYNTFRYRVPYTSSSTYINTTLREAIHVNLNTAFTEWISKDNPIQVAPILHPNQAASAFADYETMMAEKQITQFVQAYYLWRLAHPQITDVRDFPKLFDEGAMQIFRDRNSQPFTDIDEYQAIQFLEIIDYGGRLKSYRELADKTTFYPKLITLNEKGWPRVSKEYRKAWELDTYLLQSRWMGEYYNAIEGNHYTPFVLTKEEQQAADRLLDLRIKGDALPENPTERDLLANMYNQLERELWPYYEEGWVTEYVQNDEYGYYTDYISYIDYAKNPTAIAIRKRIQDAGDTAWQESLDMAHLMVIDLMINKGPETFSYYKNALEAYKKVYQEISHDSMPEEMARLIGMGRIVARKAVFAKNFEGEDEINQLGREIGELVK